MILEIPWYPPNPAHYSCLGDMRHFCLLSRVTPGIGSEGMDVNANVRTNNNIVWKNIEVLDDFTGTMAAMSMLVANDTDAQMSTELSLQEAVEGQGRLLGFMQSIQVGLPPEIYRRMRADNGRGNQPATRGHVRRAERKQGVPGCRRIRCSCR